VSTTWHGEEGITKLETRTTKYELAFMALYIVFVYVPFALAMALSGYDVARTSLSAIAWQHGGKVFIILYGTLTIPFLLFQIGFYLKFNRKRRDALLIPLIAGCVLLGVGIVFPFTGVDISSHLHTLFIIIGTVIVILAVTGIIIRYVKRLKEEAHNYTVIAILYGILIIAVASVFFIAGSVALLEIDASLIFMVVLYLVNRVSITGPPGRQGSCSSTVFHPKM